MTMIEHRYDRNLEELRSQLTGRMALVMMCGSAVSAWYTLTQYPFPLTVFGLSGTLFVLAWGVLKVNPIGPAIARHMLVWGLTVALLLAMWLLATPWLPWLGLILVFVGSMLVPGGGIVSAGAIAVLVVSLTYGGIRPYSSPGLLAALALSATLAWQVVRTLYTALDWAWMMQERADQLLETARDRQGELSRALNSLEKTDWILRRARRELIIARRQAEKARLMKEQFAANVSHELRTPLSLLLGFSEVMHLSPEVYGDIEWPLALRRDVYQIYRNSRHLLAMVNDVLDLSRFEIVGFTLEREPTRLEALLRDVAEIAAYLFRGKPVQLAVKATPGLPELEIDRIRIRQVLFNLLNNAARFTDEGSVRVETTRVDGEVVIAVSDTGPGIPEDRLPHIFEEFYQIDRSLHRKHGGAGLGLAICKHFVEAHGGRIWVESQTGVGSTFRFTLPIPGQHVPVAHLTMSRPVELCAASTKPLILVVDPDPTVVSLVGRHVETCDVIQVDDPGRVTEATMLHHPEAIVYNVPPEGKAPRADLAGDGSISLPVPIIECSLPSQAWLTNELAVMSCLTKPFSAEMLLREINRLREVHDVLVVDDDRGFCELVERILQTSGRDVTVRQAYDGEDALLAMAQSRPDLLLLDLIMPNVDGFQVLREMERRAELRKVPVVLVTATSYSEDTLANHGGRIVIHRTNGLGIAETLRCLRAVVGVLETHYDERSVPENALAEHQV
jgi:signal transduction histidine kinase/CheY-like chemotaxis protein